MSLLIQLCYVYIDTITTDCCYVNIHETRLYKGCSKNITYVNKVVPVCVRNKFTMDFNGLLTVHPDTIKVLFANLMHNLFIII